MAFDRFDVVLVPFPFTDRAYTKRRPAVLLSDARFVEQTGNAVLAMVTSAAQTAWPLDHAIADLGSAGLPRPCKVRMKLFALDTKLLAERIGRLSPEDCAAVARAAAAVLGI